MHMYEDIILMAAYPLWERSHLTFWSSGDSGFHCLKGILTRHKGGMNKSWSCPFLRVVAYIFFLSASSGAVLLYGTQPSLALCHSSGSSCAGGSKFASIDLLVSMSASHCGGVAHGYLVAYGENHTRSHPLSQTCGVINIHKEGKGIVCQFHVRFLPFAQWNGSNQFGIGRCPGDTPRTEVGIWVKGHNSKCLRGVRKASRMTGFEKKENKPKW